MGQRNGAIRLCDDDNDEVSVGVMQLIWLTPTLRLRLWQVTVW